MYTIPYIYIVYNYSYLISKNGTLNRNILSRKYSTHKYIRIKEQIQTNYDNNITIINY